MKRASFVTILTILSVLVFTACGGDDSGGSQQNPVSQIKNRAIVSNSFTGQVQIINADTDQPTRFVLNTGSGSAFMVATPDRKRVLVWASQLFAITAFDPVTEQNTSSTALPSWTESVAVTTDGKFAYAAVKNATVTGSTPGSIQIIDLADKKAITGTIPIPDVRWLALNHAGNRLLAFSDQSDVVRIVDPTATTPTPTVVAGTFSRPIAGYFSADDTKAYILSCGSECGGTQARVTEVTISSGATRSVDVAGASIGLLDGTTLYVAGAPGGNGGTIQVVDTNAMTASAPVNIGPGLHRLMKLTGGKVWVGATGCGTSAGCLSVFTPASGDVKVNNPAQGATSKGNVTGMDVITGRNVMYVAEGGELRSYDLNTAADVTPLQLNVVGKAEDVVLLPETTPPQ